jgi:hypothetical protein
MTEAYELKKVIRIAFLSVKYPGNWCLRGSNEGEEPYLLEDAFKDRNDWELLDAAFIDQAPDGFGSSLSFFSDEAFRFYLPAYMIADIDGKLDRQSPVFHLTHGLTNSQQFKRVNPLRYGERTWFDSAVHKYAIFNNAQSLAIIQYLSFCLKKDRDECVGIQQALSNYWLKREKV